MRVLLLVPPAQSYMQASVSRALDEKREHRPFLGILSVATFFRRTRPDMELKFLDARAEEMTPEDLNHVLRAFQPDLVGITCLTFLYYDALCAAEAVRRACPGAHICFGGFHVRLYPEETLQREEVDSIIVGDGEESFCELAAALDQGMPLGEIPGLGLLENGVPKLTPQRKFPKNLDIIPHPEYEGAPIHAYTHLLGKGGINLAVESSRGCPFGCRFCDIRRSPFRYRSPGNVVDAIEGFVNQGIRSFFFVDDNLTVIRDRVLEICRLIRERKLDIEFKASSRVDTVDREVLQALKDAGCSRLSIGVESCRQKYLDYLEKGVTVEKVEACLSAARAVGLPVFAYMMMGFPGQTREEILAEADFLRRHKVEYANWTILTIYPKTKLYFDCLAENRIPDDPWPAFAREPSPEMKAPYISDLYGEEELQRIQSQVMRKFYFTPRNLMRRVLELRDWATFVRRVRLAWRFLVNR